MAIPPRPRMYWRGLWFAAPRLVRQSRGFLCRAGLRRAPAVNSQQKNPGRSRGQTAPNRLAVLLLSALALTALTALTALSGLLLLLAWLLLAAAALLLARLVLAALLLAGVLLVRIVHNVSYFSSSP